MPSLGKTNTPEFGSPCYTEPDVAPPAVTPVGHHPHGRRLLRRRGRGGRRRAAARRAGLGRRRLDPDPGLVLRPRRPQAHRAAGSAAPRGTATRSAWRRPAPSPAPSATPPRCSTCWPVGGSATRSGRHLRPGRSSTPATASPGRLRVARFVAPVIADVDVDPSSVDGLGGRLARCSSRSATTSRTCRCRSRPRRSPTSRPAGPCSPRCPPAPPGRERPAAAADPLAQRARPRRQRPGVRPRHRRGCASTPPARSPRWRRTTSCSRPTLAAPPRAGRRAARRRRPGRATSRPRRRFTPWTSAWNVTGMPAVSLPLALDRRRPAGRRDARRAAGRGGAAARRSPPRSRRAGRPGRAWVDRRPPGW